MLCKINLRKFLDKKYFKKEFCMFCGGGNMETARKSNPSNFKIFRQRLVSAKVGVSCDKELPFNAHWFRFFRN